MRKLVFAAIMAFACSLAAQEAHISASYTHNGDLHGGTVQSFLSQFKTSNIGGVDIGLSAKVAGPFGLAFDGNWSHSPEQQQFLFLAGPELSARGKNVRVFGHALIGGGYATHKLISVVALADSSFAYALGGGVERYWGHVGLRTAADYIYTNGHASEHNARITGGIAFRW